MKPRYRISLVADYKTGIMLTRMAVIAVKCFGMKTAGFIESLSDDDLIKYHNKVMNNNHVITKQGLFKVQPIPSPTINTLPQ